MWINPQDMAMGVFNSLSSTEKTKLRANISNFGEAIFQQFSYTKEQSTIFIEELTLLLDAPKE